ncbi:uncharacterized protein CLUP02_16859 [Colletotrichum lupini]|uniref:Uncharacterized protein n=1 Tax=Colletotrichum lupini TaxID=145971 RepID=A0A9Q8WQK2_9PEZI|nr:uncharacterized protein CLUP02_16859 [Colletotrichum lupini]UQC91325.1 hypothetical protein CLUP02_16859 [Colletotrichum lupini]
MRRMTGCINDAVGFGLHRHQARKADRGWHACILETQQARPVVAITAQNHDNDIDAGYTMENDSCTGHIDPRKHSYLDPTSI